MGDDPDQPKKVGSDMHAKKWSEYGGHGKYTSSDPIDSSRTTTSSGGDRGGFEPYRKEGTGYPELPEHGYYARERRKETAKKIVIGFCIHSVIFYLSYLVGFYDGLCIAQTEQAVGVYNTWTSETAFPSGIIMPFWSCGDGLTLANIFGSFHLILLPLFTYSVALSNHRCSPFYYYFHYQDSQLRFINLESAAKKIVTGLFIHSVIFYVGFFASFYGELCFVPPGIIMPFCSSATGDIFHFDSLFGSFYLILPLLIYFALFGKKAAAVVVPIVTVAMLIGFLVANQQIDLGWSWWSWSELPLAQHLGH